MRHYDAKDTKNLRNNGRMRVKFDKWLGTYTIFVLPHHIVNFGRRSRIWWVLEKEMLPIRCLFMEGKVGRNSIFNLLHIPYNSHKERLFFLSLH